VCVCVFVPFRLLPQVCTCVCERDRKSMCVVGVQVRVSVCVCVFVPFRLLPQVYARVCVRERKSMCVGVRVRVCVHVFSCHSGYCHRYVYVCV